ncbi:putative membrane protein [Yersinia rochesterensis]|nr:putative membrane protein [Yersinia rochesterensis]
MSIWKTIGLISIAVPTINIITSMVILIAVWELPSSDFWFGLIRIIGVEYLILFIAIFLWHRFGDKGKGAA